jgi:hypothetical protein
VYKIGGHQGADEGQRDSVEVIRGVLDVERGMGSVKRLEFDTLPREGG